MKKLTNFSATGLNGRKETLRELRDRVGYQEEPDGLSVVVTKIGRLFAWVITGVAVIGVMGSIFRQFM